MDLRWVLPRSRRGSVLKSMKKWSHHSVLRSQKDLLSKAGVDLSTHKNTSSPKVLDSKKLHLIPKWVLFFLNTIWALCLELPGKAVINIQSLKLGEPLRSQEHPSKGTPNPGLPYGSFPSNCYFLLSTSFLCQNALNWYLGGKSLSNTPSGFLINRIQARGHQMQLTVEFQFCWLGSPDKQY